MAGNLYQIVYGIKTNYRLSVSMKQKIRCPEYFADFACIGADCEDSCCNQWQIYLDRATFENYTRIKDPELRRRIDEFVEPNPKDQTEARFGRINLTDDRKCPFLTTECLCILQKQLGVDSLSQTCLTYPRVFNSFAGMLEGSAEISCPEVARRALLNPGGIRFVERELELDSRFALNNTIKLEEPGDYPLAQYYQPLQDFSISLMQDRRLSLPDRLTVLGMFSSKMQSAIDEGNPIGTPAIIAEFDELRCFDGIAGNLSQIPVNTTRQLQLLKSIVDEKLRRGTGIATFRDCHEQMLAGIGFDRDDQALVRFTAGYHNIYFPFMAKKEYLLENYCVNYLFRTQFPLFDKDWSQIFKAFVHLTLNYALIKFYLIGIGLDLGELNDAAIVKLVYSFGKAIEHDNGFIRAILQQLEQNNLLTMAQMAIFIRN